VLRDGAEGLRDGRAPVREIFPAVDHDTILEVLAHHQGALALVSCSLSLSLPPPLPLLPWGGGTRDRCPAGDVDKTTDELAKMSQAPVYGAVPAQRRAPAPAPPPPISSPPPILPAARLPAPGGGRPPPHAPRRSGALFGRSGGGRAGVSAAEGEAARRAPPMQGIVIGVSGGDVAGGGAAAVAVATAVPVAARRPTRRASALPREPSAAGDWAAVDYSVDEEAEAAADAEAAVDAQLSAWAAGALPLMAEQVRGQQVAAHAPEVAARAYPLTPRWRAAEPAGRARAHAAGGRRRREPRAAVGAAGGVRAFLQSRPRCAPPRAAHPSRRHPRPEACPARG
jgi:hypothetical protein